MNWLLGNRSYKNGGARFDCTLLVVAVKSNVHSAGNRHLLFQWFFAEIKMFGFVGEICGTDKKEFAANWKFEGKMQKCEKKLCKTDPTAHLTTATSVSKFVELAAFCNSSKNT